MKVFEYPYKPARICKGKKEWYIHYEYKVPNSDRWKMFKDRAGLNYQEMKKAPGKRLAFAKELCKAYDDQLKSGWSPFGEEASNSDYDAMKFKPAVAVLKEICNIKKSSIKRRTVQAYEYSVNAFEKWLKLSHRHNMLLQFITPLIMTEFFDYLRLSGKYASNKSINNHAAFLKILFNEAIERELILKNPLKKRADLPEEEGKNYPYSDKQKEALKTEMLKSDPDLWLFAKCIYHLFIRESELLGIKIIDINLKTKNIIVHSSLGKNKRQLSAEIPDSFLEELKALNLQQYPDDWYLFGKGLKPGPDTYSRNSVSARYKKIKDACGITDPNYTFYSWKHTGNVDSYLAGVDIYDLMRQNRHHSIEQTMVYLRSMGLRPNVGFSSKAPGI